MIQHKTPQVTQGKKPYIRRDYKLSKYKNMTREQPTKGKEQLEIPNINTQTTMAQQQQHSDSLIWKQLGYMEYDAMANKPCKCHAENPHVNMNTRIP